MTEAEFPEGSVLKNLTTRHCRCIEASRNPFANDLFIMIILENDMINRAKTKCIIHCHGVVKIMNEVEVGRTRRRDHHPPPKSSGR
jgi:hypothetical protein